MIKFTIGGREVDPRNMEDALMAVFLEDANSLKSWVTDLRAAQKTLDEK